MASPAKAEEFNPPGDGEKDDTEDPIVPQHPAHHMFSNCR